MTHSKIHKKPTSVQSRYIGPKFVFHKEDLIRESQLRDYKITSLVKWTLLIFKLNTGVTGLGYLFHWILYVGHFPLSPETTVDKDQYDNWFSNTTTNQINHTHSDVHDLSDCVSVLEDSLFNKFDPTYSTSVKVHNDLLRHLHANQELNRDDIEFYVKNHIPEGDTHDHRPLGTLTQVEDSPEWIFEKTDTDEDPNDEDDEDITLNHHDVTRTLVAVVRTDSHPNDGTVVGPVM